MVKRWLCLIVVVGAFSGCDFKKKEVALQKEVDSLRSELVMHEEMTETLQEVGVLMDSIDANRSLLRTTMIEGLAYDTYVNRMREINEYVKTTQDKIEGLERVIKNTKSARNKFASSVEQLKKDLESRAQEILVLNEQVARYRNQNDSLVNTVTLQSAELSDKMAQLTAKQEEVATLGEQVKHIMAQSKYDLAEAYFAQAQALELAAKRTNFAPRKKKNTKREALELYKLAAVTGKPEAQSKVEQLEEEI